MLLEIVAAAPNDQLGYIGAGPLENLLSEHSAAFGERIEAQARRDPRFREALAAVWLSGGEITADLQERLVKLTDGRIRVRS